MTTKQMEARNAKIRKAYATGKISMSQLAKKVGLSKTRVCEIVNSR